MEKNFIEKEEVEFEEKNVVEMRKSQEENQNKTGILLYI